MTDVPNQADPNCDTMMPKYRLPDGEVLAPGRFPEES
jgi:hypothetical protein